MFSIIVAVLFAIGKMIGIACWRHYKIYLWSTVQNCPKMSFSMRNCCFYSTFV